MVDRKATPDQATETIWERAVDFLRRTGVQEPEILGKLRENGWDLTMEDADDRWSERAVLTEKKKADDFRGGRRITFQSMPEGVDLYSSWVGKEQYHGVETMTWGHKKLMNGVGLLQMDGSIFKIFGYIQDQEEPVIEVVEIDLGNRNFRITMFSDRNMDRIA